MRPTSGDPHRKERRHLGVLLAILALSFVLRIGYVYQMRHDPFFEHLIVNAAAFDAAGAAIAEGSGPERTAYFHPPLYPYFLGMSYRVFGHSPHAVRLIQALLGTLACLLIYLLGRRAFTPTVGLWSAGAAAIYWTLIFFVGELLPATLSILLCLLALWLFYVAGQGSRLVWWAVAGAALGLGALARPNLIFCPPFLVPAILAFQPFGRRFFRSAALYVAGAAMAVLPVTVRNLVVGHELVVISANAGHNLYLGNGPAADGLNPFPDEAARSILVEMADDELGNGAQSARLTALTFDWVKRHPARTLSLLLKKLILWWNAYEIPNNRDLYLARGRSPLLRLPWLAFALVGPLGLAGAALALRRRASAPLLVFIAAYTLSILPFFVCSRFRLPIVPVLLIFAIWFISWVAGAWKECLRTRRAQCLGAALLLAGAAVLVNGDFYAVRATTFFQIEYNTGWVFSRAGQHEAAIRAYGRALTIDRRPEALENLGLAYQHLGQFERALELYAEAIDLAPETATYAYNNSGVILKTAGDFTAAISMFERALETDPSYLFAHLNLAECYYRTGRKDDSIRELEIALGLGPPPAVREQIARAMREWSQ